ncbi:MAG: diguanylate cyclase, partial [Oscillospiraceae bacterium]
LGGDEFIVFMTNIGETYNVKRRAKDLITTISTPFQNKNDYPLDISGSVGVALFPQNGSNFDELYKNADIALYRSKSYGKNRYTLFDEKFLENYSQTGIITDIERNAALSKNENEIIGETDNIIYIRDASNHRMMYINDGAKLAYGLSDSDLGKPCYYAFHRRSSACDGCHIEKLKFDEFLVRESYNAELKKNFLVREKLIIWKGITAQILFATDITPQVTQRNEAILQSQLKQQLIETIEEISSSASLEEGIKRALNAMRQLYNGNGIILMSQPKPDNLSVEGTLSVLVDGIKAHTETAVIDVASFDCLSEQNLEFAHEHKITTALVYLSGLVSPGVIVAVLNPRANLKHLEIFEKVMRFIESQLQRQVLSEKVSAERKRYRTLISSISDSVFEYDVAEDDLTVYINDYKSYGMPDGMMIFKNASEYEKSSLDGSDLIGDVIYDKLHSAFLGMSDEPFEFSTTTLNGNELWLRIKPQKVYDSLGVLVRVVGTLKDVTESHLNSEISELNNLKVELEYRKGHDNLTGL